MNTQSRCVRALRVRLLCSVMIAVVWGLCSLKPLVADEQNAENSGPAAASSSSAATLPEENLARETPQAATREEGAPSANLSRERGTTFSGAYSDGKVELSSEAVGSSAKLFSAPPYDEGTSWNAPDTVRLSGTRASLIIRFPEARVVSALALQADNNDSYFIEGSEDGSSWKLVWAAPPIFSRQGLITRYHVLDAPLSYQLFRLRPGIGDGNYSVSRVLLFPQVPPRVPAGVQEGTHQDLVRYFGTEGFVNRLKGWTAMLGSLLLALIVGLTWKRESFDFPKAFKVALASLGIFGAALWWNLGNFHYPSSVHTWELFHYYVGAKYFPELGYTRLYDCSSVADLEDGFASGVHANKIRNLATNALEPTDRIVRAPRSCTDHFSSERWRAFKRDVGWFRGQMDTTRWSDLKRDHGFNGSPVWLILGRLFSAGGTISWDSAYFLVSLDTLFLGLLWALVWRAFGWQSACVAALVWGTNFPGRYYWVGGSLLRQDWMFALVGGICCLKLEKMRLGGALLCYSALLRVFPGFAGVPLVLGVLLEVMRQRRIVWNSPGIKFLQGGILALLVLVPLSLVSSGRWSAYQEFSANSKKHLATPLTNNMGLQNILGYSQDERARVLKDPAALEPFALWKESRLEHKSARFWLFVLIVGGYAAYITFLSRRLELWETAILGVGLIPFAAELTCYYYSFLLVYGLLWKRAPAIGMLAVLLAWVTCETAASIEWTDESYTLMSAWVLVFVVLAAWLMSRISVQRDNQALPLSEA